MNLLKNLTEAEKKDFKKTMLQLVVVVALFSIAIFSPRETVKPDGPAKCLLKGCNNPGTGWYYETQGQKTILSQGGRYLSSGALQTSDSGGYCSKEHCLK